MINQINESLLNLESELLRRFNNNESINELIRIKERLIIKLIYLRDSKAGN